MAYFGAAQYSVFELFAGEDFSKFITVKNNGVPIDTTNVNNMKFTLRRSFFYNKDVHSFNVSKVSPYTSGTFNISYPANLTKTIKAGNHVFDFFIDIPIDSGFKTIKAAEGIVVVYPAATLAPNEYYPF